MNRILFLCILTILVFFKSNLISINQVSNQSDQNIRITIDGLKEHTYNSESDRVYVLERKGVIIVNPVLLLKISGLSVGDKIFVSYKLIPGPFKRNQALNYVPFQVFEKSKLKIVNMNTCQLTSDKKGEARVLFECSTYAGDCFLIFASKTKDDVKRVRSYQRSKNKDATRYQSKIFYIWKKMFFEKPKILKGVKFPFKTLSIIKENLEKMNIELEIPDGFSTIDPLKTRLKPFFTNPGREGEKEHGFRYGPRAGVDMDFLFGMINRMYCDYNPTTLNLISFGFISEKVDLIKDGEMEESFSYQHKFKNKELDKKEIDFNNSALFITDIKREFPVIFFWSDYFFMISKVWKVNQESILARVILHEIGHYLMVNSRIDLMDDLYYDFRGHLKDEKTIGELWIMKGIGLHKIQEKKFSQRLEWHPVTQRIIRKGYMFIK